MGRILLDFLDATFSRKLVHKCFCLVLSICSFRSMWLVSFEGECWCAPQVRHLIRLDNIKILMRWILQSIKLVLRYLANNAHHQHSTEELCPFKKPLIDGQARRAWFVIPLNVNLNLKNEVARQWPSKEQKNLVHAIINHRAHNFD